MKSGSQTQSIGNMALNPDAVFDYEKLRAYYEKMYRMVDIFHSTVARLKVCSENIWERVLPGRP